MGTITKSVTVIPSGTTGRTNMTTSTNYPESRGYNNTSNTSFARWTLSTSTTGYIYYTFTIDTSDVPAGATITSVTAKARCYVNNTTRVTNTVCQLYSGTTAKGSNVTFASTSNTNIVTLDTGSSWARSDLNDLRIRIGATGSSSTSNKYVYFAGAEVTISYSVPAYDITIQNSTSATVTASESEVAGGDSVEIYADTLTGLTIKDNGTDVTSQFVNGLTETVYSYPTSYQTGGSINGTNYQSTIGKGSDTSNRTGNDYFSTTQGGSGSTWIDYYFTFSIPSGATIQSTSLTVKGHCESTSESREISQVQAYTGTTAKGTATDMTDSTTDKVYTVSIGTWTATELASAKLRHTIGVYGGLVSGATWTVTYEIDGYVYTISNVIADHAIVVTSGGGSTDTIWFKADGGSETLAGTRHISDADFNANLSVDLSSFSVGDTCRVSGSIYMSDGALISGSEADIGHTFTWTGSNYSYTVSYSSGQYTVIVSSSAIKFQASNILGPLYAKFNNEAGYQLIGFYKSSGGGGWMPAINVYKKVNGSWVEQSDLTTVFDSNTNYIRGD